MSGLTYGSSAEAPAMIDMLIKTFPPMLLLFQPWLPLDATMFWAL